MFNIHQQQNIIYRLLQHINTIKTKLRDILWEAFAPVFYYDIISIYIIWVTGIGNTNDFL